MKRLYFASLYECNQNCIFCVRLGNAKPIEYIDTKRAKDILVKKKKEGYGEVYFDGGEPTLRDDLLGLIKFAKKLKYKTTQDIIHAVYSGV